jgi:GTP-binding protein EngB required for normal cell division
MLPAGKYLLFGRTGTGKSSLINSLANSLLAPKNQSKACTKSINEYSFAAPCGRYTLYDSPGLCEDDNSVTDEEYVAKINRFLTDPEIRFDISIILVVRIGSKRIFSEDFDVVKYLAQLLLLYPGIPVVIVATFADFDKGREFNIEALDKIRMQYLLMLDRELLLTSNRVNCMYGFSGSYAVDNTLGAWFTSWHPCRIEFDYYSSFSYLINIVGHTENFICDWIKATGHSPEYIINNKAFYLVDDRILNLTQFPMDRDCQVPDLIQVTSEALAQYPSYPEPSLVFYIKDDASEIAINVVKQFIKEKLFMRRSLEARNVLSALPANLEICVENLRSRAGYQNFPLSNAWHIVLLLSAREALSSLHFIASNGSMYILRSDIIEERISLIKQILLGLLSGQGNSFLANQLMLLVELSFNNLPSCEFGLDHHLRASSAMLYLAVSFSQLTYFPNSFRLDDIVRNPPGLCTLVNLLNSDFYLRGYSRVMLDCLKEFDWSLFTDLASSEPQSMRYFLDDIISFLQTNRWLMPSLLRESLNRERNRFDMSFNDESYGSSWQDEDEEPEHILYDAEDGCPY